MADLVNTTLTPQNTSGFDITKHIPPKLDGKGFNRDATLKEAAKANLNLEKEKAKIPHWWGSEANPYNKRTDRAQLFATRKAEKQPHISFDLDGDGIVGNKDYVISKLFDKDGDGRLNTSERAAADQAIRDVRKSKNNIIL